jgi:hypothetical protein
MEKYGISFRISIDVNGTTYKGTVVPFKFELPCGLPYLYRIVFDDQYFGDVRYKDGIWEADGKDRPLIDAISNFIELWYE